MVHYNFGDGGVASSIVGFISSIILSATVLEIALDLGTAFLFGGAGAVGGLCVNALWKWIKKKYVK